MLKRLAKNLPPVLSIAGMASFPLFGAGQNTVLLAFAMLHLLLLLGLERNRPLPAAVWLPFASGLLAPVLLLFYWDRFDWQRRLSLLLFFSLLLSVILLLREKRVWQRLAERFRLLPRKKQVLAIFLGTELLLVSGSALLTRRGPQAAGDEVHYLVIAQSLALDLDLNVFNQYWRGLYRDFSDARDLQHQAHARFGRRDKSLYSTHLPGLPLTMAPFFAIRPTTNTPLYMLARSFPGPASVPLSFSLPGPTLAPLRLLPGSAILTELSLRQYQFLLPRLPYGTLYLLLRAYLGLYGALLAVLIYLFACRILGDEKRALFATLVFSLTAPVYFYSMHIFPEVQATLLVLGALYLILFPGKNESRSLLLAGLLLGATVFWGLKYALFIYLYVLGFFVYFCLKGKCKKALLLLVFPLLLQALFLYYLYDAYGRVSFDAVYYGMMTPEQEQQVARTILQDTTWKMRLETLLAFFFDQREGLLLYSPLYFFAFPGLILACRHWRRYGPALLVALPALAFIASHAFSNIRPGHCPQARYLVPALWALLLFAFIYERESGSALFRKLFWTLPGYSFFVAAYQVLHPATLYQPTTHDITFRPGLMFQQWSNLKIDLPPLLPSFVKTDNSGYLANYAFLALFFLLVAASLVPMGRRLQTWIRTAAAGLGLAALVSLSALFPRPALYNPTRIDPAAGPSYLLYEKNPYPRQMEQGRRTLNRGGEYDFAVGSARPLKAIRLWLRNRSGRGDAAVRVTLADRPRGGLPLPAAGSATFFWPNPEGRRVGGRSVYPFHLSVSLAGKDPGLEFEFSPDPPGRRMEH